MENVSRRSFVTGAAVAAASAACAAGIRAAKADNVADITTWDEECDVLVCGCGTGGAPAAIEAARAGADVLVIEKMDWCGGEMRRCGGGIAAANTQVQKYLGVEDDAESFADYIIATANGFCDEELVRTYAENSADLIDWLMDDLGAQALEDWHFCGGEMGLEEYTMEDGLNNGNIMGPMSDFGFEPVARCHWFNPNFDDELIADEGTENSKMLEMSHPGGTGVWKAVAGGLEAAGVRIKTETPLVRFIVDNDGCVMGAVAQTADGEINIKAKKGVVLATGSFASNHDMMLNYTLTDFNDQSPYGGNIPDMWYENDGSGIKAALAVGAELRYPAITGFAGFMINGLHINTDAQALNVFGEPIARLYVCSNAAGGFLGSYYPLCGAQLGKNMVFGRIAGKNVAALDSWE